MIIILVDIELAPVAGRRLELQIAIENSNVYSDAQNRDLPE